MLSFSHAHRRLFLPYIATGVFLLLLFILNRKPTSLDQVSEDEKGSQTRLTMSREDASSNDDQFVKAVDFPDVYEYHKPTKNEKFVTYLPHSGFHNQRIELENALLLAYYLNRTLILPPVYLSNPAFPWNIFDKMYSRLLLQTKHGLEHCHMVRTGEPLPTECLSYHRWTTVPWTFFYPNLKDLTAKTDNQLRIVFRNDDDLSVDWIKDEFKIPNDDDIYLYKDYSPFDYRVYDLPDSTTPLKRFTHRVELHSLKQMNHTVLHFGSLFGTYRVLAQKEEHNRVFKWIRQSMIFTNPDLVSTADKIVSKLGGARSYVGIHLRVSDGLFRTRASIHVDDIYHKLVNDYTDLTVSELEQVYDKLHDQDRKENAGYETRQLLLHQDKVKDQQQVQEDSESEERITVQHPYNVKHRLGPKPPQLDLNCQFADGRNNIFSKSVIFIATDCSKPREHPLLRKIFRTFPCTFVLDDFKGDLEDLSRIQVKRDKVKLESWLIPMVDAIIASKGHTFYGTTSSTFSTYIERQLHPAYTNQPIKLMDTVTTAMHHSRGGNKRSFDRVDLDVSTAPTGNGNDNKRFKIQSVTIEAPGFDALNICCSCHRDLHKPCTLPCGYTICSDCLQEQQSQQQPCRHCERVHTITIQPNVLIQQLQDVVAQSSKTSEPIEGEELRNKLRAACECSICCHLLKQPATTLCGHTFCRGCLVRSLDHQRQCPFCREQLQFCPLPTDLLSQLLISLRNDDEIDDIEEDEEKIALGLEQTETRVPLLIGSVAFPHIRCALHIFEPRYRLMLRRIMSSGRKRLAMCLRHRSVSQSAETAAAAPFHSYGTMLELTHVQTLADGRSIVEAVGSHRFSVVRYNLVDGYHMADIERIDDIDPEQQALLEQRQILRASAKRTKQQQQQQQRQQQHQESSIPLPVSTRPLSFTASPLSTSAQRPASSPSTALNTPSISPMAPIRPSYTRSPQSAPTIGQRTSWAQQAHPQTRPQINRAPWLQMHMRGLTAAKHKSEAKPSIASRLPTSSTAPATFQPQPAHSSPSFSIGTSLNVMRTPEEQSTDDLIEQIVVFIEKIARHQRNIEQAQQQSMSHWLNVLADPPTPIRGPQRDRVILIWWVINMLPISEDEKVPVLALTTLRERVLKVLSWINRLEDQWSFWLNSSGTNGRFSASPSSSSSSSAAPLSSCCIS